MVHELCLQCSIYFLRSVQGGQRLGLRSAAGCRAPTYFSKECPSYTIAIKQVRLHHEQEQDHDVFEICTFDR